jgi:hypothetical protein
VNRSRSALHATGAGLLTLTSCESAWAVPARVAVRPCAHVIVTGGAVFDCNHKQTGVAPNALEPHPLLSFRCTVRARLPRATKPPGPREVLTSCDQPARGRLCPGDDSSCAHPCSRHLSALSSLADRSVFGQSLRSDVPPSRCEQVVRVASGNRCTVAVLAHPRTNGRPLLRVREPRAECLRRSAPVACCLRVPVLRNAVSLLPNRHNHELEKRPVLSDDAVAAGRRLFKPGRA